MDSTLKDKYFEAYNTIRNNMNAYKKLPDDATEIERIRLLMEIIYANLVIGENEAVRSLLADMLLPMITPENFFSTEMCIRAYVIYVFICNELNDPYETDVVFNRMRLYVKDVVISKKSPDYDKLVEMKEMADNYIALLALLVKGTQEEICKLDKKTIEKNLEFINKIYENNKNTITTDMRLSFFKLKGEYLQALGNSEGAVEEWTNAANYASLSGRNSREGDMYRRIADLYEEKEDYENALSYYERFRTANERDWVAREYAHTEFLIKAYGIGEQEEELKKLRESNEVLTNRSMIDALTGLHNRRKITEFISETLRNGDEQISSAVIVIDIDDFKEYNDNYGRDHGDKLLVKVASLIKEVENYKTLVARCGGQEFMILMVQTKQSRAIITADRILQKLANLSLPNEYSTVDGKVTVSMGISSRECVSKKDFFEMVNEADHAMVISKNNGKNKYTVYSGEN